MKSRRGTKSSNSEEDNLKNQRAKIETEVDYIAIKRFDYSLSRLQERYPNGAPDNVIASALLMEEKSVANLYKDILAKLREIFKSRGIENT